MKISYLSPREQEEAKDVDHKEQERAGSGYSLGESKCRWAAEMGHSVASEDTAQALLTLRYVQERTNEDPLCAFKFLVGPIKLQ